MEHKTDTDLRVIRETLEALFEQRENAFGRVPEALRALDRVLAASAGSEPVALPFAILADEMAALRRFDECVRDDGSYDISKEMMKRLAGIGLVRRMTGNIYEHTTFGLSVLNGDFATHPSPPEGMVGGWISVDERLPGEQGQDSEQVMVFINGHCELTDMECRQGGAWGLRLGYFDAERQAFRVHGRPEPHVTHWCPEPPAPPIAAGGGKDASNG